MGEKNWVIKIKDELEKMPDISTESRYWNRRSIYRVPDHIAKLNEKAYKPQRVSIGPYHHGKEHLKPMEEHKHRALLHFLKSSGKPLESYLSALAEVVQDLKEAYDSLDLAWQQDTDAFLRLVILDGCFMLEILRMAAPHTLGNYAPNDPVFSNHGKHHIMPYLRCDMLMLENQLPLLALETLLAVEDRENANNDENYINELILKFCSPNTPPRSIGRCLHLLDAYRKSLHWQEPQPNNTPPRSIGRCLHLLDANSKSLLREELQTEVTGVNASQVFSYDSREEIIRSAAELHEAGIRFKKSKSRSQKDVSFHDGVLLPLIVVDDAIQPTFLNLIAYERHHSGVGGEVTSYVFLMNNIIENAVDVRLLNSHGIIQNALGNDKSVAKLFNSFSNDTTLDPGSSLGIVHKKVNEYCKKPWNTWRANLIHTYFRNPWSALSVIAAIILFLIGVGQAAIAVWQIRA